MEYDKLSLFCSNCKIIGHDLSYCRWLQHGATIISSKEKTIATKIQQYYRFKMVGAQDETKGSLAQSIEPLVELIVKPFIVQPMVV